MMKKYIYLFLFCFVFGGCAQKKVQPDIHESAHPPVLLEGLVGPPLPPEQEQDEQMGPMPAPDYVAPREGYVLVLGPGLARSIAYIGVLRGLEEKKIDIRAIVGVEMGAIIAGLWASSNANTLEWQMHKLKRSTILDTPILSLGSQPAEGKKLYYFLEKSLKAKELQQSQVPIFIASAVESANELLFESTGPSVDIIRGAMGIPGILKSYLFAGKERMSAALEFPFPARQAKQLGLGKVFCVDVLGTGNNFSPKEPVEFHLAALMKATSALAREQLKECDVVLSVPMDGMSYVHFDLKAEFIYRGRQAVEKNIP